MITMQTDMWTSIQTGIRSEAITGLYQRNYGESTRYIIRNHRLLNTATPIYKTITLFQ